MTNLAIFICGTAAGIALTLIAGAAYISWSSFYLGRRRSWPKHPYTDMAQGSYQPRNDEPTELDQ